MKRRIISRDSEEDMDVEFIHQRSELPVVSYSLDLDKLVEDIAKPFETRLVERNQTPCGADLIERTSGGPRPQDQLVQLAQEISQADAIVQARLKCKLSLIREQTNLLYDEALHSLQDAKESVRLNHIPCNFKKVPGTHYYVYRRPSSQEYFSMLSPQEWNGAPPHEFVAGYRLEKDLTWTKLY